MVTSLISTFMGIAIHNLSTSTEGQQASIDLAAGVRQDAAGLLGTTVQLADLVSSWHLQILLRGF